MTVLSDLDILRFLRNGDLRIFPFNERFLNPAGYDLRSAYESTINPRGCSLTASLENIEVGLNIIGTIHLNSSLTREGLIGSFAIVDPGFKGQLTLMLYNSSNKAVKIGKAEPIAQIVFHLLSGRAGRGYRGISI